MMYIYLHLQNLFRFVYAKRLYKFLRDEVSNLQERHRILL